MCPGMAMLPYLDVAKHFLENAPADFEFPAWHENSLRNGLGRLWAERVH